MITYMTEDMSAPKDNPFKQEDLSVMAWFLPAPASSNCSLVVFLKPLPSAMIVMTAAIPIIIPIIVKILRRLFFKIERKASERGRGVGA
jgi:hypothetical protein